MEPSLWRPQEGPPGGTGRRPASHRGARRDSGMVGEAAKFTVVGGLGTVVNLAAFAELQGSMPSGRANALSTVVSIAVNYVGYRYWVYRNADARTRSREIMLFLVFSGIGAVIQVGVVYAATYYLHLTGKAEQLAAAVGGIGLATVFRFISYRTWVFRVAGPEPDKPAPPPKPAVRRRHAGGRGA